MSEMGSILPATWTTLSSAKQRTTCAIASVSRIVARNWLPSPSPFDAPATSPAMSTNSTVAGQHLFRMRDRGERAEARIGHLDDADVGLDRAERIVLGGDARARQRVEERRLADVGQPDDAAFEAHGFSFLRVQQEHRALEIAGGDRRPRVEAAVDRVVDGLARRRATGGAST